MFEYFALQIPPRISVQAGTQGAAAKYLGEAINSYAVQGWEFCSVETIGVIENMGCGCLAAILSLFGIKTSDATDFYVIVFKRPRST